MNTETYQQIPPDVRAAFGPDDVTIDESIPTGQVVVFGAGGGKSMPVNAFVRARRANHKRERRNRRRGRR